MWGREKKKKERKHALLAREGIDTELFSMLRLDSYWKYSQASNGNGFVWDGGPNNVDYVLSPLLVLICVKGNSENVFFLLFFVFSPFHTLTCCEKFSQGFSRRAATDKRRDHTNRTTKITKANQRMIEILTESTEIRSCNISLLLLLIITIIITLSVTSGGLLRLVFLIITDGPGSSGSCLKPLLLSQ